MAENKIIRFVWRALAFVLAVLSLSVVAYAVFASFYSTEEEKELQARIKAYKEIYPEMPRKLNRIGMDLDRLSVQDDMIYEDIFHAAPPVDDPMASLSIFFGSDSIPDSKLVFYSAHKADRLLDDVAAVDSIFVKIVECLKQPDFEMPPMLLPLKDVNYMQVGAGTGNKINPFYTTPAHHDGVDFIVPQGADVFAPADGVVSSVKRSRKGEGNTVTINHAGGYVTHYSHLSDIFVTAGKSVKKGARIAAAGMTGNSYAPHLHYEVWRDSLLNPLNYIFASVSPEEYTNMVYMARHTQQSMD